ncbi:MAG: hypothetical protein K1X78_14570 [Verrucomicrobiaceae bacterium]|nr:hypothetical protein [Verrucomicrobiaceae bacterium]
MLRFLIVTLSLSTVAFGVDAVVTRGTARIDGVMDEAFWAGAAVQGEFAVFRTERRVADTSFRIAHDDAWFYVGIECRHETLRMIQPRVKGHDKGVAKDESVEVFVAPRVMEPAYYYRYALSFGGARDESIVTGRNVKDYWNVPWRSAVRRSETGWTAEIAVPMALLKSGGGFEDLRINVARNRRVPVIDSQNVVVEESRESSSWSPVNESFHEQAAFRAVTGIPAELQVRAVPLVGIDETKAEADGVRVTLRNHGAKTASVRLMMNEQKGEPVNIDAGQTLEVKLPMTDAVANVSAIAISVLEAGSDEVLATQVMDELSAWRPLTAYLDRNYYTDETHAVVHYGVTQPAGLRLTASAADGELLAQAESIKARGTLRVLLRDVIVLRLHRGERVVFEQKLPARRLPIQPGAEWKVDQSRRIVLNNGRPFVPFGMVMAGVREDDEAAFAKLAAHRFNTFLVWHPTTPEGMANYQRMAAKHGLALISCPDECATAITWEAHARYTGDLLQQVRRLTDTSSLTQLKNVMNLPVSIPARDAIYGEFFQKNLDRMIAGVEAVKRAPNVAAHFIMDEPMAMELFSQVKFGQEYFARVRRSDGHHPVIVNYSSHIPEGDDYTKWCDILATDPYWYPPAGDDTRSTPNHVAKIAWMTNQRAEAGRQAVWQILACPRWSRCFKRPLTSDEIRCQTWLALIYRATGILTFAYNNMRDTDWQTCARLGDEIKTLTPFIAGPIEEPRVRYECALIESATQEPVFTESPFDPKTERYPDVHVALLTNEAGHRVLLAANSRPHPVRCQIRFDQLEAAKTVFGAEALNIREQSIDDTLEPFATRAWFVKCAATPSLTVHQIVLKPDLARREPFLPGAYRSGHKNVLPNASFEDTTAEGIADYCLLSSGATMQDKNARFGKRCVQLTKTTASGYENLMLRCDPPLDQPQTFTFSVYLKADADGRDAWLRGMKMNPEKEHGEAVSLKLTTEWQRYSITGKIPAKVSEALYEIRLREPGTIWIDGAQLERGEVMTEFEE